ncbi:FAD-binding domain-containing protein [Lindgomyces ingoldianus]|uniref:FAD-binding domain-containing protein n=1 Tax=Lindgomyces ingoldianus TaxID=673940 RepID=A0ACB6QX24_9PLEO|nr:FAD-binding domain-containing protein [Lindgomyces ingoldianus]KAF2471431.1 FAD-binding domain-containing protein [Lindgomyces ingoldianus]
MNTNLPILIIGGGIVGLTLAQALHKARIPSIVFERDVSSLSVGGWGITVHWALPAFESCLPPHIFNRLRDIQVDPEQGKNDTGRFVFLDLSNAEPRYIIPPSKRLRIHRKKLRTLLTEGVPVVWHKSLLSFTQTSGSILAHFEDGTTVEGALLVGADGSSSRTRRLLYAGTADPDAWKLNQLPVRFMGVTMRLAPFQAQVLREIDPLLFQGSHPTSGVFLWYSILSTPEVNGSGGIALTPEYYEAQLCLSWRSTENDVPVTNQDRVAKMKFMARNFEERLRNAVWNIPDDAEVLEINIQDWPTQRWDNKEGLVTLCGDAAHAMTMYRGEAFNHGITDAARLSERIIEAYVGGYDAERLHQAVDSYEVEMRERTRDAVLLSRQACLDAHDIDRLGPQSPLVSKRAKVLEPGQMAS